MLPESQCGRWMRVKCLAFQRWQFFLNTPSRLSNWGRTCRKPKSSGALKQVLNNALICNQASTKEEEREVCRALPQNQANSLTCRRRGFATTSAGPCRRPRRLCSAASLRIRWEACKMENEMGFVCRSAETFTKSFCRKGFVRREMRGIEVENQREKTPSGQTVEQM